MDFANPSPALLFWGQMSLTTILLFAAFPLLSLTLPALLTKSLGIADSRWLDVRISIAWIVSMLACGLIAAFYWNQTATPDLEILSRCDPKSSLHTTISVAVFIVVGSSFGVLVTTVMYGIAILSLPSNALQNSAKARIPTTALVTSTLNRIRILAVVLLITFLILSKVYCVLTARMLSC